jgi:hypothetical protein
MKYSKYDSRKPVSPEAATEVEIIGRIEDLLRELENQDLAEERREEIGREVREILKRYHQLFGKEAQETIDEYYRRLKILLEK